jgi:diguanylate cyclase (GGDEF)-like protein
MSNPFRSLAGRITLLVFMATLVSSLAVSWISVQSLDGFLRQKVDQRFPQAASYIAHELEAWYALRTRDIEVFANSAILTESTPYLRTPGPSGDRARDEAAQYLRYVLESFPQFERLILATPEGEPLVEAGSVEPLPEDFLTGRSLRSEHLRISEVRHLGDRAIQIASVPMRGTDGRPISWFYAMIDIERLDPMLISEELGEEAMVFLIDRDRRFLNPPEGFGTDVLYEGGRAENEQISSVAYYHDPNGIRVVGARTNFPRFGWTVVIEQPYDEAFSPVVGSMSRVAALNVTIVLVVGLIALRIAGSIVKPLRALSTAARRLSLGERKVEIDETTYSSDEVNVLTRTFNEMSRGLTRNAEKLEENQREIEAANSELVITNVELSKMNEVLEQLSITDGLTKLHNHRYFQESIDRQCKRSARTAEPLCLLLIDIDMFKGWNDRLGHAGGDEILRRISEVLNESVRETDILARYGGEEFAVLAINTDLEGARALGEKVRSAVYETEFVEGLRSEDQHLTVSVGIAAYSSDRKQLFSGADSALYAAKDAGRNRVIVDLPSGDSGDDAPDTHDDDGANA